MTHRKNEHSRTWFRSHRTFRANDSWYFHTREGIDVGPFASEFEAQVEASILKHLLKNAASPSAAASAIREFVLDLARESGDLKGLVNYIEKEGRF
jgi:hypothetical protein